MSDYFDNKDLENSVKKEENPSESNFNSAETSSVNNDDVYSHSGYNETTQQAKDNEGSYEWNGGQSAQSGTEYHYSYINGNNETASHNPNNYDSAYSSPQPQNTGNPYSYSGASQTSYSENTGYSGSQQPYGSTSTSSDNGYGSYNGYNGQYSSQPYSYNYNTAGSPSAKKVKRVKAKKPKKQLTRSFVAVTTIITIVVSAALGFGGGYFANRLSSSNGSGSLNINKVTSSASGTSTNAEGTAANIVKQTSDSVVEITTESVVTGSFARQYVQQGAGSGVIISEDGYIITNNHVIDGANSVTVTLRDGATSYNASLIGTDAENDIALLKVDANGLSPATFGDSSKLAVGDYVVAIGNPLGQLGGTVTDGIISSLAREVTIEDQCMTLLQTNAQVNPGNSGGGLFNANGELIGIVNAKESATEVEGIAFAIPINNVLDIIEDLKSYGYVTGKIDLGMELTDINSNETAFYYGVSKTGCYVLSVTSGSNAASAGFKPGDLITKADGKEVTSSADIKKITDSKEVGDTVTFTVYRSGKTGDIKLTLAEYVPSAGKAKGDSELNNGNEQDDSIWSQMFDWH